MIISFDDVDEHKWGKIMCMNEILGISEIDTDVYISSVQKIIDGLKLKKIKNSTICQYISAISGVLFEHGIENNITAESKALLPPEEKQNITEEERAQLETLCKHKDNDIRLLAGVVLYGLDLKINVTDMVNTSVIDRGGKYPYLDIDHGQWTKYLETRVEKVYPVNSELVKLLKSISGVGWLLENKSGQREYDDNGKKLSKKVNKLLSTDTYASLRKRATTNVKPEADDVPKVLQELQDEVICEDGDICVDPREIFNAMLKSGTKEKLSPQSIDMYVRNLYKLQGVVLGQNPMILVTEFCRDEVYEKVAELMKTVNPNTAYMLLTPLSRVLETIPNMAARCYTRYRDLTFIYRSKSELNEKPAPREFSQVLNLIDRIYGNDGVSLSMKVIMLMIKHSTYGDEYDIGMLRLSDLIHTRIGYSEEYSYIDLESGIWHIRKQYTKNRKERKLKLRTSFTDELGLLYCDANPKWMVFKERKGCMYEKYDKAGGLSSLFRSTFGCAPKEVRASYAIYLNENCTLERCKQMAENMGHRYNTVIADYVRHIEDDSDESELTGE